MSKGLFTVGKISGHFGIKGWVKVYSYTEPSINILNYTGWVVDGRAVVVEKGKQQGKSVIVKFKDFALREETQSLLGKEIQVDEKQLPDLAEGDFYWNDLIGLTVINLEEVVLGQVVSLFATGANDVLVAEFEGKETLIPYIPDTYIKTVDLQKQILTVDWEPLE